MRGSGLTLELPHAQFPFMAAAAEAHSILGHVAEGHDQVCCAGWKEGDPSRRCRSGRRWGAWQLSNGPSRKHLTRPVAAVWILQRAVGSPDPLVFCKQVLSSVFNSLSETIKIVQATGQELLNQGPITAVKRL